MGRLGTRLILGFVTLSFFSIAHARPDETMAVRISGHVPNRMIQNSSDLGHLSGNPSIGLVVPMRLKNGADLETLIQHLHTPDDALYGKYLSTSEFKTRFAPSDAEVAAVEKYFAAQGLSVKGHHANNLFINLEGHSQNIENALGIHFHQFRTSDNRLVYAPVDEPLVEATVASAINGVVGLNNFSHWHHHLRKLDTLKPFSVAGSGKTGYLVAADIRKVYNVNMTQTGAGQTVALIEFDSYLPSDLQAYASINGITLPTIKNVAVDGGASGNEGEAILDLDMVLALAPAATIMTYTGPDLNNATAQQWIDTFSKVAADNIAKIVSASEGGPEVDDTSMMSAENNIFQQMASQGQSMFVSTGDSGAYSDGSYAGAKNLGVNDPASQPYVTAVGGTTLTSDSGENYVSETAWGNPNDQNGADGGGGGISAYWTIPSWQRLISFTGNSASTTKRNIPDVALNSDANTGYEIAYTDKYAVFAGTSAASPLWAAFMALVNQQRAAKALSPIGFVNPALYLIGASLLYTSCFHDVTAGNNLFYNAVPGFDLATGWGSANFGNLFNVLTTSGLPPAPPTSLTVKILGSAVNP